LSVAWSPDGRYLLASARPFDNALRSRLVLFDLSTGSTHPLLDSPATVTHELSPVWSPDGVWIAVASTRGAGGQRIYKVHPDGLPLTAIRAGGEDGWPRWRR